MNIPLRPVFTYHFNSYHVCPPPKLMAFFCSSIHHVKWTAKEVRRVPYFQVLQNEVQNCSVCEEF